MREMNARIAERWKIADTLPTVPVKPPNWADRVVDSGAELIAVHVETGAPYPLSLHDDLSPEDRAVVIARRLMLAGAGYDETARFIRSFGLTAYAERRLVAQLQEVSV